MIRHGAARIRTTHFFGAAVDAHLDALRAEAAHFGSATVVVGGALVTGLAAALQVVGVALEALLALAHGLVLAGRAVGIRAAADAAASVHAVEDAGPGQRTHLVLLAVVVGLAVVGSAAAFRIGGQSRVAGEALARRVVLATSAVGSFWTPLAVADVDTVADAVVRENARLIFRALVVVVAQMLRRLLAAVRGITYTYARERKVALDLTHIMALISGN